MMIAASSSGVLSIGSMSTAGLQALPTQWSFAEESAAKHGNTVERKDWRVVLSWHLAESKAKAREEAKHGLLRWHNEYTVGTLMRPGAVAYDTADEAIEQMSGGDSAMAIIGTPDELIDTIRRLQTLTGGFGTVIGFVNDWANPEATSRSWDMVARYVIPEVRGMLDAYRDSQSYVINNREVFDRAGAAVISKIMENERAVKAMSEEANAQAAIPAHHAPKLGGKSAS